MRPGFVLSSVALIAACSGTIDPSATVDKNASTARGDGHGGGTALAPASTIKPDISISYNGGPVLLGTPNAYFIWYGNWTNNTATTILPDFMQHLGGSPYFDINTTYYDSKGNHVTGLINYAGSTTDNYSQGTALASDAAIEAVVEDALYTGALPTDTNGVYFVLTSHDVTLPGFCNSFCGWHENGAIFNNDIKYAFVGDASSQCPSSCAPYSPSPNGNLGADGMASVLAHEMEESITDPDLNAWEDSAGENADKCAWKFGTTYTTAAGASANMKLGTRDYLIQENLVETTGLCALSLGTTTPPPPPVTGPTVKELAPAAGATIHPGGALDITASVTDSATISSVKVNWTSPSGTTQFAMSKNSAGNYEFASTLSSSAQTGTTRSFTITATDANGKSATTASVSVKVQ
jgi:hypothetical protein